MAYWGAVIGAVGSVAASMISADSAKSQKIGPVSTGNSNQMMPQTQSLAPIAPTSGAQNPAFGQFLGR